MDLYRHLLSWGGPLQSLGGCCHKCMVITRSRRSVVRLERSNGFRVGEREVGGGGVDKAVNVAAGDPDHRNIRVLKL